MANFSPSAADQALQVLADVTAGREQDLNAYPEARLSQGGTDDEDSESPIMASFSHTGGNEAIRQMTNFNLPEFQAVYNKFLSFLADNYNVGRGKKSQYKAKDVFFMCLTVCKHEGMWGFLGRLFGIKGPTFERLIISFLQILSPFAYTTNVESAAVIFTMTKMMSDNRTFRTFKLARYASDVTFQQSKRPNGNVYEGKKYFSGKHKLYGYKTEVSVLPNGLAIGCTDHYAGSVADVEIFCKNVDFHKKQLRKSTAERDITDIGIIVENYRRYWAVLMDKGYQGASQYVHPIYPVKKPRNGYLTVGDQEFNLKVSSDRIIVENFFERQCTLWAVMANKYRWAEKHYDVIFAFTLAMTNAHIMSHPLRAEDGESFQRLRNKRGNIGVETAENLDVLRKGIETNVVGVWLLSSRKRSQSRAAGH